MNKKTVMYAWLGLLGLLILGVIMHYIPADQRLIPIWITEAGAFALLAFSIYRPTAWSNLAALGGSVAWLFNQLFNWYGESQGLGGFLGNNIAGYTTLYLITAVVVGVLGFFAVTKKKGSAPLVSSLGGVEKTGMIAFGIMGLFGFWKIYINWTLMSVVPPADFNSRVMWGLGVGLAGFASAWSLKSGKKEAIYLALIGLAIAAIAAIGYGRGLSLIS